MDTFYEQIVSSYFEFNPLAAHSLGFHEYDGKLPDISLSAIENRLKECRQQLKKLEKKKISDDKIEMYHYELIKNTLLREIFDLDTRKEYLDNPAVYIFPLAMIEMSYTSRNFAPKIQRVRSIIELQKGVPQLLENGLTNLESKLAKPKIRMSIQFGKGIRNYWSDKLIEFVSEIGDEKVIQEWSEVNLLAIEALDRYIKVLNDDYLPQAHSNFALGKDNFLTLLKYEEGVELSAEKLIKVGEKDLNRNYKALVALGKEYGKLEDLLDDISLDQPDPNDLLETSTQGLKRIRDFIISSKFVTLPTRKQCKVIHTPEFMRAFASGAMNTPGPFESGEASQAYFWITPPDPELEGDKLTEYMKFFSYPMLEILAIHEVWPGHYLQLLYNNKSEDRIAKMFARSTSMIEGWAHYTEEEIIKAGYNADGTVLKEKIKGAQLLKALMRDARYLSAVNMHCFGMTLEESEKLFHEKAFMSSIKSKLEANRGTMDPMYLNYTLGKLMIYKLRADYKKELKAKKKKFSLRKFHNQLLSYGSPPITVLRKLMLDNPGGPSDVL